MKSRRYPRVTCLLRVEELETRLTPAPVVLQPDFANNWNLSYLPATVPLHRWFSGPAAGSI